MTRRYLIYGVLVIIEVIVAVNLLNIARNVLWTPNLSPSDYQSYVWSVVVLGILAGAAFFVLVRIAKLNDQCWSQLLTASKRFVVEYRIWLLLAGLSSVFGLITFGAIGFVFIAAFETIIGYTSIATSVDGANLWGIAVFYAIVWGWWVFIVFMSLRRFLPEKAVVHYLMTVIVSFLLMFLLHIFWR